MNNILNKLVIGNAHNFTTHVAVNGVFDFRNVHLVTKSEVMTAPGVRDELIMSAQQSTSSITPVNWDEVIYCTFTDPKSGQPIYIPEIFIDPNTIIISDPVHINIVLTGANAKELSVALALLGDAGVEYVVQ